MRSKLFLLSISMSLLLACGMPDPYPDMTQEKAQAASTRIIAAGIDTVLKKSIPIAQTKGYTISMINERLGVIVFQREWYYQGYGKIETGKTNITIQCDSIDNSQTKVSITIQANAGESTPSFLYSFYKEWLDAIEAKP